MNNKNQSDIKRVLVFHTGSLGDTLVSVPALHVVRDSFPHARISMLTDQQVGKNLVSPQAILASSGLIDNFITYNISTSGSKLLPNYCRWLQLLVKLRLQRFDTLVYLVRTYNDNLRIKRDQQFFRLSGIKTIVGDKGFYAMPDKDKKPLPEILHIADQFLSRLKRSGLSVPEAGHGNVSINIGAEENTILDQWLDKLPDDGGKTWVGFGPGSKMSAKIWPLERYATIGRKLIENHDIWPIVFGGPEDQAAGEKLLTEWGRGYVAAGHLDIRSSVAALSRCIFYVGNDTGTMHMAVSAGLKCGAVFSARDFPGQWYPYGSGHFVIRKALECEGCMLEECNKSPNCIELISDNEVFSTCQKLLKIGSSTNIEPVLNAENN